MAPTTKPKNTDQCQSLILTSLSAYYKKNNSIRKQLFNLINGDSKISLRLIDWFVTHYARVNSIIYWIDNSGNIYNTISANPSININEFRKFNMYLDYRAQLQSYTKLYFDPFRRYSRISFILEEEPLLSIESTVGQLNFFRWALQNGVIMYIQNNIVEIEKNMMAFQKQIKQDEHLLQDVKQSNKIIKKQKNKQVQNVHIVSHVPCLIHFD